MKDSMDKEDETPTPVQNPSQAAQPEQSQPHPQDAHEAARDPAKAAKVVELCGKIEEICKKFEPITVYLTNRPPVVVRETKWPTLATAAWRKRRLFYFHNERVLTVRKGWNKNILIHGTSFVNGKALKHAGVIIEPPFREDEAHFAYQLRVVAHDIGDDDRSNLYETVLNAIPPRAI